MVPPPLIRALLEPGRYPHPVDRVELIETHVSWVLLAGDFVYKIKRPVDLGFLDFTDLDRRRRACEDEVRLNRRLAPDLYLGVSTIGGRPDDPRWGVEPVLEYAVRMYRFPQEAQLDRMLEAGRLEARHIDAMARLVAEFHQSAPRAGASGDLGAPDTILHFVEENFRALGAVLDESFASARLAPLASRSRDAFAGLKETIATRKRHGFVREGHGDLHLRNLAWVDDAPLAFDCIEFDPALRWIDVMNEIAFLVMDLEARGESAMAARFLNFYLEHTGDYAGLSVLSFYLCYRALVRAKVEAIHLHQGVAGVEREGLMREVDGYLDLAWRYTEKSQPWLVITRGPSGSGKTTRSLGLVEDTGAIRIRSDVERKRLFGVDRGEGVAAEPNEGIYTPEASRATYEVLVELAGSALRAGVPVIVDAVFATREQRRPFESLAGELGVPFVILEFEASPEVLRTRVRNRPRGASDADERILAHQLRSWTAVEPEESGHVVAVDTQEDSSASLWEQLRARPAFH